MLNHQWARVPAAVLKPVPTAAVPKALVTVEITWVAEVAGAGVGFLIGEAERLYCMWALTR